MPIESVMPSNHVILCRPLLLLSSIFPSIRVFSNESTLHIRWPKYWSFSFSISPSNEYSGLISFRMELIGSPCSPRDSQESSPTPQFKSIKNAFLFIYLPLVVLGRYCCMQAFSICREQDRGWWGVSGWQLFATVFSLWWLLLLQSTGSRLVGFSSCTRPGSCPLACGIFPDQESNPFPLHWQAVSYTLCPQICILN